MRAICASSAEGKDLCDDKGQLSDLGILGNPLNADTEKSCIQALQGLAKCELAKMPTTLQNDLQTLESMGTGSNVHASTEEEAMKSKANFLAVAFRVEKKKLLNLASKWSGGLSGAQPGERNL